MSDTPHFVYALKSDLDGGLYIGMTNDVERRLGEHNAGHQRSTKHRRPFQLLFVEECPDRATARLREKYYKSGSGREYLRRLGSQT